MKSGPFDGESETPRRTFGIRSRVDALAAAHVARELALAWGWSAASAGELSIVVAELAMNTVRHAHGGQCRVTFSSMGEATVEVQDDGPGFPDEILADAGRSDQPRFSSMGMGSGLAAARRLSDSLALSNRSGGGAAACAQKKPQRQSALDRRIP